MDPAGRPTRFKDSCDSCAQAKIKCSRDRPSCLRCLRNGVICCYSLARRGKAASAPIVSEKANLPKSSAAKGSQRSVMSLAEDVNSHLPDFPFVDEGFAVSPDFTPGQANPPKSPALSAPRPSVTNLVGDFSYDAPNLTSIDNDLSLSTDSLTSRGSEARQMAGIPHDFGLPSLGLGLDCPLLSRIGHGGLNKRDVPVSTIAAIHSALTTLPQDQTESQPDDRTLGTDRTGDISASDSSANIHVLLSTLKSLHMPPMMPTPGFDMILKVTSMAVGNLSALLKDPCGLNSSNVALLALVCCNSILEAYQQVLLIHRDPISASDDNDHNEGAMDCSVATTPIAADMHIAVGEYLPEGSVKQKIIFSVLLGELTRLGKIMERIIPSSNNPTFSVSRSMKESGGFISTLNSLLQERLSGILRVVKAEIINAESI